MKKTFWQKLKKNHFLMMIVCCLVPVFLIIFVLGLFKEELGDSWIWLIFLLCPIAHIWIMKGHNHNKPSDNKTDNKKISD